MKVNADFDRIAAAWLADGPTELSDRVLDAALREVHLTYQRRRSSAPWRTLLMPLRLGGAVAIVIVAVAAILAFNLIGGVGTTPTATEFSSQAASPSAVPTALPTVAITTEVTALDGTWGACFTVDELIAAGGATEAEPGNYGCQALRFDRGAYFISVGTDDYVPVLPNGTYRVDRDRLTIRQANGEVFDFTWSVVGESLTLEKVPGKISPTPLVVKSFKRLSV